MMGKAMKNLNAMDLHIALHPILLNYTLNFLKIFFFLINFFKLLS